MSRPDPLQLPETAGPAPRRRRRRRRLSRGQTAALAGFVFFATAGVALFPVGLAGTPVFAAGMGWMWVIGRILAWAETLDA